VPAATLVRNFDPRLLISNQDL